jgi:hypothetical protein
VYVATLPEEVPPDTLMDRLSFNDQTNCSHTAVRIAAEWVTAIASHLVGRGLAATGLPASGIGGF